ncbi:MAG: hypothetical protein GEU79_00585 [Acidimicrobiia bacterium]|nr:hypothetical protein [Acidimicrobiia bacterium]
MVTGSRTHDDSRPTATELGVGARLSLYPMTDDFVAVILGALAGVDETGLQVVTDDVSTYIGASTTPDTVTEMGRYITAVVKGAAETTSTGHVVAILLLSRGCPGEVSCESDGVPLPPPDSGPMGLQPAGVVAAAHWSVYPLDSSDHMGAIDQAVLQAQRQGTFTRGEHYVTRLDGDLSEVITTIITGWLGAGPGHVTSHATISVGSPTDTGESV